MRTKIFGAVSILFSIFLVSIPAASAAPLCDGKFPVTSCVGVTADGAPYAMQVPANFNGTVLIYSHGYRPNVDVIAGIPGYGGYKVTNTPETAPGQAARVHPPASARARHQAGHRRDPQGLLPRHGD